MPTNANWCPNGFQTMASHLLCVGTVALALSLFYILHHFRQGPIDWRTWIQTEYDQNKSRIQTEYKQNSIWNCHSKKLPQRWHWKMFTSIFKTNDGRYYSLPFEPKNVRKLIDKTQMMDFLFITGQTFEIIFVHGNRFEITIEESNVLISVFEFQWIWFLSFLANFGEIDHTSE